MGWIPGKSSKPKDGGLSAIDFFVELDKLGISFNSTIRDSIENIRYIVTKSGELEGFHINVFGECEGVVLFFRLTNNFYGNGGEMEGGLYVPDDNIEGTFKFRIDKAVLEEVSSYVKEVFEEDKRGGIFS